MMGYALPASSDEGAHESSCKQRFDLVDASAIMMLHHVMWLTSCTSQSSTIDRLHLQPADIDAHAEPVVRS
jgi:hypothetical protein